MNEQQMLDDLVALLEAGGVRIRSEPLGGAGGGLCKIKGEDTFFLDTEAALADTAQMCAESLLQVADIETIYIRPEIREFIESCRSNSK